MATTYRTTYSRKGKIDYHESRTLGPRHAQLRERAAVEGQWAETEKLIPTGFCTEVKTVASVGESPIFRCHWIRYRLESYASAEADRRRKLLENIVLFLLDHRDEEARAAAVEAHSIHALIVILRQEAHDVQPQDCLNPMKGDYYAVQEETK